MRSLICRAIVKKACSTLDAFLAEVSRKGIPRLSANSYRIERRINDRPFKDSIGKKIRRGGQKGMPEVFGAYLRHGVLDHLLVLHIALVTDEQLVDALGSISVNLLKPLLDIVE